MSRPQVAGAVMVGLLALGVGGAVLFGGGEAEPEGAPASTTTTTAAPTTTTTEATPDGPVAPLTGRRVFAEQAPLLERPALVVKVDNHPDAFPHRGLDDADVVVEVMVEGISRFMAVYHSADVAEVAPVRSSRTSDADLTAMFGRPLFAWSGANPSTTELTRSLPWVDNVDSSRQPGAYSRSRDRRAPHNLVLDARRVFAAASEPVVVPTPLFDYRPDEVELGGAPVDGLEVVVGGSRAAFAWNAERRAWERHVSGRPHRSDGETLAVTNLVVLETRYERSAADLNSPEAVSIGSGRAWVLSDASMVEGTWERPERTGPWQLRGADGTPIALTPGTTWVALGRTGPELLAADAVAALRDG